MSFDITESQISWLPRWARVAFAAYCAELALKLVQNRWKEMPPQFRSDCQGAINAAKQAAFTGREVLSFSSAHDRAMQAGVSCPGLVYATFAANSARCAVESAFESEPSLPYQAWNNAKSTAASLSDTAINQAMKHGFESISSQATKDDWTDETTVLLTYFGSFPDLASAT